ncbi:DNA gyrase inhibitor YacG [Kordiimonas sp. SCSIO 12603]|uniref:DNA gyrase inhibitor YacG n=1 Tax=Kordiimonas sp. SCSIO 12603 TaxID=2829596 RepID=UPI0021023EB1|nr:DNA gyrase inhibitor YacG [Kordiimonas sp. SCSIO 12603]UTW59395.1 DNA gyrase inhibitor YacG [Kordiimonas sp. SCSIO 12603]
MTEAKKQGAKCPQCNKPTDHKFRPFCSKRCADVDLGKWFSEGYVLPGDTEIPDELVEE